MLKAPANLGVHYRPFHRRRSQSVENLLPSLNRAKAKTATAITHTFGSSYNVYAASKRSPSRQNTSATKERHFPDNTYGRWLSSIKSKIRDSPNYQPPAKLKDITSTQPSLSTDGASTSSLPKTPTKTKGNISAALPPISPSSPKNKLTLQRMEPRNRSTLASKERDIRWQRDDDLSSLEGEFTGEHYGQRNSTNETIKVDRKNTTVRNKTTNIELGEEYSRFREQSLNMILLRGLFTKTVIEDCFRRQMRRNSHLDTAEMERVMLDTMRDLGITSSPTKSRNVNISSTNPITRDSACSTSTTTSSGVSSSPSRISRIAAGEDADNQSKKPEAEKTPNRPLLPSKPLLTGTSFSFDDGGDIPLDVPPPVISFNASLDDDSI